MSRKNEGTTATWFSVLSRRSASPISRMNCHAESFHRNLIFVDMELLSITHILEIIMDIVEITMGRDQGQELEILIYGGKFI